MKLIIDISEEVYKTAKNANIIQANADMLEKTIINGIPLDKIRAEIEAIDTTMGIKDYPFIPKAKVLEIIDKYR